MKNKFELLVRLVVAGILVQTLFFKFTAAPESVYIFSAIDAEPWGRIASGFAELIAAILILIPATVWIGALLSLGIISGALTAHFTTFGIEVMGDGGTLFILAIIVFTGSVYLLYRKRMNISRIFKHV